MPKRKTTENKKVYEVTADSHIGALTFDFSNRFNLKTEPSNRVEFKNRCINAIGRYLGELEYSHIFVIYHNIVDFLGVRAESSILGLSYMAEYSDEFDFDNSEIHDILVKNAWDLSDDYWLYKWLIILEIVANSEEDDALIAIDAREKFTKKIAEALSLSDINAIICKTPDGYKLYPSGAKLLDSKLVVDVLNWLNDYPKAKEPYNSALRLFFKGDRTRHVLDDCRLALEMFAKQFLCNDKLRLEVAINDLCKHLEAHNTSKELRNMFRPLLDYFTKHSNENVKHNVVIAAESEIEFIIYLTGAFIRLLILTDRTEVEQK